MGTMFQITCKNCIWTQLLNIGFGSLYAPVTFDAVNRIDVTNNAVLSSLHYKHKEKAEDFLDKSEYGEVDYEEKAYTCPKCNRLYSRLYVKITSDIGVYEIDYKCSKCRTSLSTIDIETDIDKCACSECGEKGLISSFAGHWD